MAFITDHLNTGKENAITANELCTLLNISIRDLSAAVERERRKGSPICASNGKKPGYYLAANKEEMQEYCKILYKRAGEIHKTRKACLISMINLPGDIPDKDDLPGQMDIWEYFGKNK